MQSSDEIRLDRIQLLCDNETRLEKVKTFAFGSASLQIREWELSCHRPRVIWQDIMSTMSTVGLLRLMLMLQYCSVLGTVVFGEHNLYSRSQLRMFENGRQSELFMYGRLMSPQNICMRKNSGMKWMRYPEPPSLYEIACIWLQGMCVDVQHTSVQASPPGE